MKLEKKAMRDLPAFLTGPGDRLVLFSMTGCEPCAHLKAALDLVDARSIVAAAECEYDGRDVMGRSAMLRRGVKSYPALLIYRGAEERSRFGAISTEDPAPLIASRLDTWAREVASTLENNPV